MQDITVHHMDGKGLVKAKHYRLKSTIVQRTTCQDIIVHRKLFAVHEATNGGNTAANRTMQESTLG
jgi:hypothetical protein